MLYNFERVSIKYLSVLNMRNATHTAVYLNIILLYYIICVIKKKIYIDNF